MPEKGNGLSAMYAAMEEEKGAALAPPPEKKIKVGRLKKAAKIVAAEAPEKPAKKISVPKKRLERLGKKARIEAPPKKELEKLEEPPPEEVPPPMPVIETEGKTTEELLLEIGEIPHYFITRRPEWGKMGEKEIQADVKTVDTRLLQSLSEFYDRLEAGGDLTEKEKVAAKAMRDRLVSEGIKMVLVDEVPLSGKDFEAMEGIKIKTLGGQEIPALGATTKQLAEGLYVLEHEKRGFEAPVNFGEHSGSPFDPGAPDVSEFMGDIKPIFGPTAAAYKDPNALLKKVESMLGSEALLKRIYFGTRRLPITEATERQAEAEAYERAVEKYTPPEYKELQEYYRKAWAKMDYTEVEREMVRLNPEELLNTYKIYYMMGEKGELNSQEEALTDEMKRIIDKFEETGILKEVTMPDTRPPMEMLRKEMGAPAAPPAAPPVAPPVPVPPPALPEKPEVATFKDYVGVVNELFSEGALPDEVVDLLAKQPAAETVMTVLKTGEGTEDEKKLVVGMMDALLAALPVSKKKEFAKSSGARIYKSIYDTYA
jgi:hypothetical protein